MNTSIWISECGATVPSLSRACIFWEILQSWGVQCLKKAVCMFTHRYTYELVSLQRFKNSSKMTDIHRNGKMLLFLCRRTMNGLGGINSIWSKCATKQIPTLKMKGTCILKLHRREIMLNDKKSILFLRICERVLVSLFKELHEKRGRLETVHPFYLFFHYLRCGSVTCCYFDLMLQMMDGMSYHGV